MDTDVKEPKIKCVFTKCKKFLSDMFNINLDKASYSEIEKNVYNSTVLKGSNMCILILAILIASIGLNMNSTAVVIGAMLISPLMGQIIGIAYGFATNDFRFSRKRMLDLLFEVIICIITSTIYFSISPISSTSHELLARTNPTIWDVLIAFCGGLAGMIGSTRKEKMTTVIPGVAIATALMPPLCTAGYGLATLQFKYFLGALYLFFINSFFICLGSIFILLFIKLPKKEILNKKDSKRVKRNFVIITTIMLIPSIFLAYQIVHESIINNNFESYINSEFTYANTQVVKSDIDLEKKEIKVAVIGSNLTDDELSSLKSKLSNYGLNSFTLDITQTVIPSGITEDEVSNLINAELTSSNSSSIVSQNSKQIETLNSEILKLKTKVLELENKNIDSATITQELKSKFSKVTNCIVTVDNSSLNILVYLNSDLTDEENSSIDAWIISRFSDYQTTITKQVNN